MSSSDEVEAAVPLGWRPPRSSVPEDLYASWCPSPSPDGTLVAFVSDRRGTPEVWIGSVTGGDPVPVACADRRVTEVTWSPTGTWLACAVAPGGASRTEVWVMRPDGSDAHCVAGAAPGTAVLAAGRSRGWTATGELVVTEVSSDSRVLRIDPDGAAPVVLAEGELIVALDVTPDGRRLLLRRGPRGERDLLVHDVVEARSGSPVVARRWGGSTDQGCLSPDGRTVHARTDADRDQAALVTLAVGAGAVDDGAVGADVSSDVDPVVTRVEAHGSGELDDVALSADGTVAALTWNVDGGRTALTLVEVASGRAQDVAPLPRPVVHGGAFSPDGCSLVLTAEGPADPCGVWCLDVAATLAGGTGPTPLVAVSSPGAGTLRASRGASASGLDPSEVVAPELRTLSSADGTILTGWLYRPPGERPSPTLVWLHGGPEAQERPVYSSLFQSLLARGVAVFAPNVRGSTGHGRAFRHADDGVRRYGAFEDVVACAAHLVDTEVADPGRLGLAGRSYGGYLTLATLVRHPEVFAVGVDVCGMSDLLTFYAHTEPWIAAAAVSKYGHPIDDRDLLRDLSPLAAIDRLRAPLLIVHGADDTNVPLGEAEQLATALAARRAPHRLLVFEGEGHELLATPNRVAFVHAVVGWVVQHLSAGETVGAPVAASVP